MKIKKDGQVIRLTESDLRRIVKRVLTEGAGGGCKCPDGTLKPECCNTEAQKKERAMKKALTKQFFTKKPKGTMTIGEYGTLEMVNGSKDGIVSPSGVPDFKDLWSGQGFGRGFESGNGKFTYVYTTEKGMEGKEQLLVSNAPDNKGGSCDEGGCYYYSKK